MDNLFNFPNTLAPAPEVAPPTPAPEVAPPTPAPELAPAPRSTTKEWEKKLEELKTYLNQHNKRPSSEDKNKDVKKYGKWINHQISNHKKKEYIMSIESIRQLWENFINDDKYKNYFISNHEKWKLKLEQVKEYINTHQKAPYGNSKDTQEKIYYNWIICQRTSYKGNYNIMSNESIRRLWEDFINEYKNYFK
jgi:hypothetical protein